MNRLGPAPARILEYVLKLTKSIGNKGLAADHAGIGKITGSDEKPLHPRRFEIFLPGLPKHIFTDLFGIGLVRVINGACLI